jgi:hypothetical protein
MAGVVNKSIDVRDEQSLHYWCDKLHASEEELRRAVDQVGTDPHKVREHLFGGFSTAGPTS